MTQYKIPYTTTAILWCEKIVEAETLDAAIDMSYGIDPSVSDIIDWEVEDATVDDGEIEEVQ